MDREHRSFVHEAMRSVAAFALVLGCAAAPRTVERPTRDVLLVAAAPTTVAFSVAVLDSSGELRGTAFRSEGCELCPVEGLGARGWHRGPGEYRLVVGWVGEGRVPRRVEVPVHLRGEEEIVLLDASESSDTRWSITVWVIERARCVRIALDDSAQSWASDLVVHNACPHDIGGFGAPEGFFQAELVRVRPEPALYPRSRAYCGTGMPDRIPRLEPGGRAAGGQSPFAMGDRPSPDVPGQYLWIVPIDAEGWSRVELDTRSDSVEIRVARVRAAFEAVTVPAPSEE